MTLFTQAISTESLKTIIENQFWVKRSNIETITHRETPDMNVLHFHYQNRKFILHHHLSASYYGFDGALLSLGIEKFNGENDSDRNLLHKTLSIFATSLGGLVDTVGNGEDLQSFSKPGSQSSEFMLKQLFLKGFKDDEILEVLEELEQRKDLIKKSNC
jgi:hypothetical protein